VTELDGQPRGISKALLREQTKCLRTVAGACKATAARTLETELYIPPLDLYLNGRVARFVRRLRNSGIGQLVQESYASIVQTLRRQGRRRRRRNTVVGTALSLQNDTDVWTQRWLGASQGETDQERILTAFHRDWRERWEKEERGRALLRGRQQDALSNPRTTHPQRLRYSYIKDSAKQRAPS
jgi:hypothetical protein